MRNLLHILFAPLIAMSLCACSVVADAGAADQQELGRLRHLPLLFSTEYTCAEAAGTANRLRKLGKDRILRLLAAYDQADGYSGESRENVPTLCVLLFELPADWKVPLDAVLAPKPNAAAARAFADYPLAWVDGVPFLVVRPAFYGPGPDNAGVYIEACKDAPLKKADIPETGFGAAVGKLLATPEFQKLYPDANDGRFMEAFLKRQAGER